MGRWTGLKSGDVEVKEVDNILVVRLVNGVSHIMIPAYESDDQFWGDSILSPTERERITYLLPTQPDRNRDRLARLPADYCQFDLTIAGEEVLQIFYR